MVSKRSVIVSIKVCVNPLILSLSYGRIPGEPRPPLLLAHPTPPPSSFPGPAVSAWPVSGPQLLRATHSPLPPHPLHHHHAPCMLPHTLTAAVHSLHHHTHCLRLYIPFTISLCPYPSPYLPQRAMNVIMHYICCLAFPSLPHTLLTATHTACFHTLPTVLVIRGTFRATKQTTRIFKHF